MTEKKSNLLKQPAVPPAFGVDLTPWGVNQWPVGEREAVVAAIAPGATFHHKLALAWSMADEMKSVAMAGGALQDADAISVGLFNVMGSRLDVLERLLQSLCDETCGEYSKAKAN